MSSSSYGDRDLARSTANDPASQPAASVAPGKRTLSQRLAAAGVTVQQKPCPAASEASGPSAPSLAAVEDPFGLHLLAVPVQRATAGAAVSDDEVHAAARHGTAGVGGQLPYADAIQRSFGRHEIGSIRSHTDDAAAEATAAMGARAFASGTDVAFAPGAADLHTAAHEAAHVVQQRGGVQLAGGVGAAGDIYEQHADAVADRVEQGRSAEALLDAVAPPGPAAAAAVQRKEITAFGQTVTISGADDFTALLELVVKNNSAQIVSNISDAISAAADDDEEDASLLHAACELMTKKLTTLLDKNTEKSKAAKVKFTLAKRKVADRRRRDEATKKAKAREQAKAEQAGNECWNYIQATPSGEAAGLNLEFMIRHKHAVLAMPHRCFLSRWERVGRSSTGARDGGKFGLSAEIVPAGHIEVPGDTLVLHMHCDDEGTCLSMSIKLKSQERLPGDSLLIDGSDVKDVVGAIRGWGLTGDNVEEHIGNFN